MGFFEKNKEKEISFFFEKKNSWKIVKNRLREQSKL